VINAINNTIVHHSVVERKIRKVENVSSILRLSIDVCNFASHVGSYPATIDQHFGRMFISAA
jgi:hypothetical protein